jgi:hypothetical protein
MDTATNQAQLMGMKPKINATRKLPVLNPFRQIPGTVLSSRKKARISRRFRKNFTRPFI